MFLFRIPVHNNSSSLRRSSTSLLLYQYRTSSAGGKRTYNRMYSLSNDITTTRRSRRVVRMATSAAAATESSEVSSSASSSCFSVKSSTVVMVAAAAAATTAGSFWVCTEEEECNNNTSSTTTSHTNATTKNNNNIGGGGSKWGSQDEIQNSSGTILNSQLFGGITARSNNSSISHCDGFATAAQPPAAAFGDSPQSSSSSSSFMSKLGLLKRQPTMEVLKETSSSKSGRTIHDTYDVDFNKQRPIGVGNFGNVYKGYHLTTGQPVAIKQISKQFTNSQTFQREMDVLLHLEQNGVGGHPSVCSMHEHFVDDDDGNGDGGQYYYLVFDYIEGGELFDQLCKYGAYSEADAARTIQQVASALAFLHGIGVVHSDVKPENLMLSSESKKESTCKIVDFGCAHLIDLDEMEEDDKKKGCKNTDDHHEHRGTGLTPAYCPPEIIMHMQDHPDTHASIRPSFDMWSLGVIMYIMLTGVHPFDLDGDADADQMADNITATTIDSNNKLPIRDHSKTKHLSEDALCLLERLMEPDPAKRMTAEELLEKDWVRGKTASSKLMKGSDRRLAEYRRHQTQVGSSIFKGLLNQADKQGVSDFAKRTSIIEIAFRDLDPTQRGYISTKELTGVTSFFAPDAKLSLNEVQQLVSENMVSKYFKTGDTICEEGKKGDSMYFVHSGSVELSTTDGFHVVRKAGQFFGEEALLENSNSHGQTATCLTPVHVLEISRDYFDKYLKADHDVELHMAENNRLRQRERAKVMFGLSKDLKPKSFKRGQVIFREQQQGNDLFIMDEGRVDITVGGQKVRTLQQGEITGEHAAYYAHKPYNVTARCKSDGGCTMQLLNGSTIRKLCEKNKELSDSFKDIILRRDFKKAVVRATRQDFPQGDKELRHIFSLIDTDENGEIRFDTLKNFVVKWDPEYTDDDVRDMLKSLDLGNTGTVTWDEFKRVFSMFNEA